MPKKSIPASNLLFSITGNTKILKSYTLETRKRRLFLKSEVGRYGNAVWRIQRIMWIMKVKRRRKRLADRVQISRHGVR